MDGIVGMFSPVGGPAVLPPVAGRRGAMSGGNSVYGDNARVDKTMKVVVMAAARKFKEAISNL